MTSASQLPVAPDAPRRRGEETAERILDAAEALFAERGMSGTTLRDVAARVGLRNPSLYNHFASKDSLYAAVLERGMGPVLEALSALLAEGREAHRDPEQVVGRMQALLVRRPTLARLLLHETLAGGPHLTPLLHDWLAPALARARELVAAHPAAQRFEAQEIPLLVLALYHAVVGYFAIAPLYRELGGDDLMTPEALDRQTRFLARLVTALLGDGGAGPPDPTREPEPPRHEEPSWT